MNTPKRDIAWVVSGQLGRAQAYSAADIDQLVREVIRDEYLDNPLLAPDHIRVAMVEVGYLTRDVAGGGYRVAEGFLGPEEEAERERNLLLEAGRIGVRGGVINCPVCGVRLGATALVGHCQRMHNWSARWPRLVEKYCR